VAADAGEYRIARMLKTGIVRESKTRPVGRGRRAAGSKRSASALASSFFGLGRYRWSGDR